MRRPRAILFAVLLVAVVVLGGLIIVYRSLNAQNAARPEALAALESTESVTVTQSPGTDWLVFEPNDEPFTTGLIIYPGGFVDPIAYAPIAKQIAEQGYLVVVDRMPLNLAVTDADAGLDIIDAFPAIASWAIAGHSLGGAMAAQFAAQNEGVLDGLALWAAYPPESVDLTGAPLSVVSIYGEADGVATVPEVLSGSVRLPADAMLVPIPGGNHTQFGSYGDGLQRGDNPAGVSPEDQRSVIVLATVALLQSLTAAQP